MSILFKINFMEYDGNRQNYFEFNNMKKLEESYDL